MREAKEAADLAAAGREKEKEAGKGGGAGGRRGKNGAHQQNGGVAAAAAAAPFDSRMARTLQAIARGKAIRRRIGGTSPNPLWQQYRTTAQQRDGVRGTIMMKEAQLLYLLSEINTLRDSHNEYVAAALHLKL